MKTTRFLQLGVERRLVHLAQHLLAGAVGGVGLAREHELHRALAGR